MLVIPAIDIKGGRTVRLRQGKFDREIGYAEDPLAVAAQWAERGAPWLHLVDLDGAQAGRPAHLDLLQRIARAVPCPVQAGGGFRSLADIDAALGGGIARIVLGTAAPALAAEAASRFGDRVAAAVDVADGRVAAEGWTVSTGQDAATFARALAARGIGRFIYTATERDGMLAGPDLAGLSAFLEAVQTPVIASGGVASEDDLAALAQIGVEGVIVGRALYEGRLDLPAALQRWGRT